MEGEGEPTEISQLKRDLKIMGEDFEKSGNWLAKAMENSWEAASQLVKIPTLEDVLGERHRIMINKRVHGCWMKEIRVSFNS